MSWSGPVSKPKLPWSLPRSCQSGHYSLRSSPRSSPARTPMNTATPPHGDLRKPTPWAGAYGEAVGALPARKSNWKVMMTRMGRAVTLRCEQSLRSVRRRLTIMPVVVRVEDEHKLASFKCFQVIKARRPGCVTIRLLDKCLCSVWYWMQSRYTTKIPSLTRHGWADAAQPNANSPCHLSLEIDWILSPVISVLSCSFLLKRNALNEHGSRITKTISTAIWCSEKLLTPYVCMYDHIRELSQDVSRLDLDKLIKGRHLLHLKHIIRKKS